MRQECNSGCPVYHIQILTKETQEMHHTTWGFATFMQQQNCRGDNHFPICQSGMAALEEEARIQSGVSKA